jgi:L-amino acid N-acyltransferase YncA
MTLAVRAASLADAEAVAAIYKKGIADRSGTFPIDILTNERGGTVTY